ncbi:hypothetical protein O3S80_51470 [Streptomyces sp. Lzd4kr]|nr:hypothetical protein [Streptomyces sp. Lzd4kr]
MTTVNRSVSDRNARPQAARMVAWAGFLAVLLEAFALVDAFVNGEAWLRSFLSEQFDFSDPETVVLMNPEIAAAHEQLVTKFIMGTVVAVVTLTFAMMYFRGMRRVRWILLLLALAGLGTQLIIVRESDLLGSAVAMATYGATAAYLVALILLLIPSSNRTYR